jgi:hypothetical protein
MKWVLPIVVMLTVPAHVSSFDGRQERGFPFVHFRGMGVDPFEMERFGRNRQPEGDSSGVQEVVLDTCRNCHSARGIFSVNCYTRSLSSSPRAPANLVEDVTDHDQTEAIYWKQRQYDWGLLQGLWRR